MVGGRIKIGMKEPVAHFVTAVRPSKPTSLLPLLIERGGGGSDSPFSISSRLILPFAKSQIR